MNKGQQADLEWRDGVPISRMFNDPYFSLDDGLAETIYVFLDGNDLPGRFVDGFHIGELGFGTGLNLLATWQAWTKSQSLGTLQFTSFEAYPMAPDDMARALAVYPTLADHTDQLIEAMRKGSSFQTDTLTFNCVVGDARDTLPQITDQMDAWFLDGFAPAQNPELWQPDLLNQVAIHTKPGGTFATYTAAGAVRRALGEAGFQVERRAGFGRKRHMSVGRMPS